MADEQQMTAETQVSPEAIVDVQTTADRLAAIASQSLDATEVARQIEELTSVVLDSAEVSTRSASIAADVSATMRAVVTKIQDNNRRNVMHSRIMLGAFCTCLLIAMGIFFGVTLKMTKSIKELDTMVYAMAKRVIEVDASLTAIGKTNSDFSEITDKQEEVISTQTQVAKRLEEIGQSMSAMPAVVAVEANKSTDLKFKDMQKQLSGLESKLQTISERSSTSANAQGPSTLVLLSEIQKIKSELNAAVQVRERAQTAAETTALKNIEKSIDKATLAAAEAQKAADKAAQAAKAAAASEKASAAERLSQQKAAAERAVAMRMQPEKQEKSAEQLAAERAAAEKAAAARAAKAAADKAAADKAAAAERVAAAERARAAATAAAAAAAPPVVREKPIQYPRVPD